MYCDGKRKTPLYCRGFFGLMVLLMILPGLGPEGVYAFTTPEGYDEHDYQRLVAFLEQSDGTVKNGKKISADYNLNDPGTWRKITWSDGEKKRVTHIEWYSKNLVGNLNLSGCSALVHLDCDNNQLTSLNLSSCPALQSVECSFNALNSLNVSGCSALQQLSCSQNNLRSLDLSGCPALQELFCTHNPLTSLDLSGCSALQSLECSSNALTSLNLSGCLALQRLTCSQNYLRNLDLSGCPALQELSCTYNPLTSLDLSGCSALQSLECSSNALTSLNLSGCLALQRLSCSQNNLRNLDLSGCPALQELSCGFNLLTSLNLNGSALQELYCSFNQLISLNLNCPALQSIDCNSNQLTSLDLSGCPNLQYLRCPSNQLISLNLSNCTALQHLSCDSNLLTTLDLSHCPILNSLSCHSNQLTTLDLSHCPILNSLSCHSNQLTTLDLSHCPDLSYLSCYSNQLTFSSLPVPFSGTYSYSPQSNLPIGAGGKVFTGERIDLSAEAQVDGVETVFTWYNKYNERIAPTTAANGVFTFDQSFARQTIYCRMTNTKFPDLTLETSKVLVVMIVDITRHPRDATVNVGDTATFTIAAETIDEGGFLSYQWQRSTDGGNVWDDIPGATDTSYTTPAVTLENNCHRYRCKVTSTKDGASSGFIYSNPAILRVVAISSFETPAGYNEHDYRKLLFFLEQSDGAVKNGKKISANYDPEDPSTWARIEWSRDGDKRVTNISWGLLDLTGSLDLSGCSALVYLDCFMNKLTSLNLSGCPALQELSCFSNQLTSLDLTGCMALQKLECASNQLPSLDLSHCPILNSLSCHSNQLTTLDLSNCTALQHLSCDSNQLTSLDLSGCPDLQKLWCRYNDISSLNLSGCFELQSLYCDSNELTSLDLTSCKALQHLECNLNQLTSLNLKDCSALQYLECAPNQLPSLDLSSCSALRHLRCDYNQLTTLDLSHCPALQYLSCHNNQLTSLNLSGCTALQDLECAFNQLTFADLPVSLPVPEGTYRYSPQKNIPIGAGGKLLVGTKIDLSAETQIDDVNTIFTWYKNLEKITPATAANGVFIFDQIFAGQTVFCQMTNAKFPDLILITDPVLVVNIVDIINHPRNTAVYNCATATFTIFAKAVDAGQGEVLTYQWQVSTDGGKTWDDIPGATNTSYTISEVTFDNNGHQYRCKVIITKDGISFEPLYSNAATLRVIEPHQIAFIKPTNANDINNPVNINSGSLVLAKISGDISAVASVIIKVDNNPEQSVTPSGDTIYYLLPANLSTGTHTITLKLTNTAGQGIAESVTFYWESYRRGFGFGRFDFGEAPAEE